MSLRAALAGAAALLAASSASPASAQAAPNPPPADGEPRNAPGEAADLPIPPVPPRIAEGHDYEACLDMLTTDPAGAEIMAAGMTEPGAETGASEAAQHCHALAQVELGNTEDGAALLDKLAASSHAPSVFRAVVFGQADQAWTMSGRTNEAYASASQALALSPDDPDLRIGHAIAALALRRYAEAAQDLTHALALDPRRAEALVLRATAERNLDQLSQARADIDAAAGLDPDDPDGLLERGVIRQRQGDLAGARADWQRAAQLGADTPSGDLAEQYLELLAAGPRQ